MGAWQQHRSCGWPQIATREDRGSRAHKNFADHHLELSLIRKRYFFWFSLKLSVEFKLPFPLERIVASLEANKANKDHPDFNKPFSYYVEEQSQLHKPINHLLDAIDPHSFDIPATPENASNPVDIPETQPDQQRASDIAELLNHCESIGNKIIVLNNSSDKLEIFEDFLNFETAIGDIATDFNEDVNSLTLKLKVSRPEGVHEPWEDTRSKLKEFYETFRGRFRKLFIAQLHANHAQLKNLLNLTTIDIATAEKSAEDTSKWARHAFGQRRITSEEFSEIIATIEALREKYQQQAEAASPEFLNLPPALEVKTDEQLEAELEDELDKMAESSMAHLVISSQYVWHIFIFN